MPKVLPAHEVGLPQGVGRVRVSTSRARRGKILAVEHPVFGWVRYREWALLGYVERLVERIGPLELVAWVGLTLSYRQGIRSFEDFTSWLTQASGDVGGLFSNIGQFIFGAAIPETTAAVGAFFGGLGADPSNPLNFLKGVTGLVGGEVQRWFWAAIAAAITIVVTKASV